MPNYIEDVEKAGWAKTGKHWTHPDHPDKQYWSPVQVYESETFPGKRPYSVTPPEKKPEAPKVEAAPVEIVKVEPVVEVKVEDDKPQNSGKSRRKIKS